MNGAQGLRTRDITQEIDEITQKKKKSPNEVCQKPSGNRRNGGALTHIRPAHNEDSEINVLPSVCTYIFFGIRLHSSHNELLLLLLLRYGKAS